MESALYFSVATPGFRVQEIDQILDAARRNNPGLGITGMLLYHDGRFAQVIEGEPASIDALLARIAADARHSSMRVLIRDTIQHRAFPDWSMGSHVALSSEAALDARDAIEDRLFRAPPAQAVTFLRGFYDRMRQRVIG